MMPHEKFQNHRPPVSEEEENFFKNVLFIGMVTILVMRP